MRQHRPAITNEATKKVMKLFPTDDSVEPTTRAFNAIVGPFIIGGLLMGMGIAFVIVGIVFVVAHFIH